MFVYRQGEQTQINYQNISPANIAQGLLPRLSNSLPKQISMKPFRLPKSQTTDQPQLPHNKTQTVQVKLSDIIIQPGVYTGSRKLDVSNKNITVVDKISDKYRKVEEVILKNNKLSSFGEINQFTSLRILDIRDNSIRDQNQILRLVQLKKLEKVLLAGNPVLDSALDKHTLFILEQFQNDVLNQAQYSSNSEDSVLHHYSSTATFNPHQSTSQDPPSRIVIPEGSSLENDFMDILFLQSLKNKLLVHIEMAKEYFMDQLGTHDTHVNMLIQKYRQDVMDIDAQIAQSFKTSIRSNLVTLQKSFGLSSIEESACSLERLQEKTKQQLLSSIRQEAAELDSLRRRQMLHRQSKQNVLNFSPKKKNRQSSNSPDRHRRKSRQTKENYHPAYQSSGTEKQVRSVTGEKSEAYYQARYNKNLIKNNPVYHLLYSPLTSLKPKEKDILIQSLSTSLKQRTIELYKKEDQLKYIHDEYRLKFEQLEYKIAELSQTSEKQRTKIEEYESNQASAKTSENNIIRMQKHIDRLILQVHTLKTDADRYRNMYEEADFAIHYMKKAEDKGFKISEKHQTYVKKEYMKLLVNKFQRQQKFSKTLENNRKIESVKLLEKSFRLLNRQCLIQKFIALRQGAERKNTLFNVFNGLIHYCQVGIKSKAYSSVLLRNTTLRCISYARANTISFKIERFKKLTADNHYRCNKEKKVWTILKQIWIRYCGEPVQEMIQLVESHYARRLVSRVWLEWLNYMHTLRQVQQHELVREHEFQTLQAQNKVLLLNYLSPKSQTNSFMKTQNLRNMHNRFPRVQLDMQGINNTSALEYSLSSTAHKLRQKSVTQRNYASKTINFNDRSQSALGFDKTQKTPYARIVLRELFEKARSYNIEREMHTKLKQFFLQQSRETASKRLFYRGLVKHSRDFLGYKTDRLTCYVQFRRSKQLFIQHRKNQHRLDMIMNRRVSYLIRLAGRTFNAWKFDTLCAKKSQPLAQLQPHPAEAALEKERIEKEMSLVKADLEYHCALEKLLKQQIVDKDEQLGLYQLKFQKLQQELVQKEVEVQEVVRSYEEYAADMKERETGLVEVINNLQAKLDALPEITEPPFRTIQEIKSHYNKSRSTSILATVKKNMYF